MDLPTNVDVNQEQSKEEVAAKGSNLASLFETRIRKRRLVHAVSKLSVGGGQLPRSQAGTRPTAPLGGKKSGHCDADKERTRNVMMDDGRSSASGKHPRNDEIPQPFSDLGDHNAWEVEYQYHRKRLAHMSTHMLMEDLGSCLRRCLAAVTVLESHEEKARETEEGLRAELNECKRALEAEKAKNVKWGKDYGVVLSKYQNEKYCGQEFHASKQGKEFVEALRKDAVKIFCESRAFQEKVEQRAMTIKAPLVRECRRQLRETGLVTEKVIMVIEPHIPELVQPEDAPEMKLFVTTVQKRVIEDMGSSVV